MVNRFYKVYDNFNQELRDFDIVVTTATRDANQLILGLYFNASVVVPDNFTEISRPSTKLTLKRPPVFSNDAMHRPIDRNRIDSGNIDEDIAITSIIKINSLTEDMLILRTTIIDYLNQGRINSNVNRNFLTSILEKANEEGRI